MSIDGLTPKTKTPNVPARPGSLSRGDGGSSSGMTLLLTILGILVVLNFGTTLVLVTRLGSAAETPADQPTVADAMSTLHALKADLDAIKGQLDRQKRQADVLNLRIDALQGQQAMLSLEIPASKPSHGGMTVDSNPEMATQQQ